MNSDYTISKDFQVMGQPSFSRLDCAYGDATISTLSLNFTSDFTKQYDTKITYGFNVAGMKIKCAEKFVNKTKEASLIFTGEGKVLDTKLTFHKEVPIDANIYENYDWKVKNGILYVTLFEKINEKPPILDILSKKMNKFDDEICVSLESKNDTKRR